MPVRRVLLTETNRPSAGFVQRLFYNWLAADLRGGHMTTRINGSVVTLSEAERLVRYARKNGWIVEPPSLPGDSRIDAENLRCSAARTTNVGRARRADQPSHHPTIKPSNAHERDQVSRQARCQSLRR
jgi:hypothetical protein